MPRKANTTRKPVIRHPQPCIAALKRHGTKQKAAKAPGMSTREFSAALRNERDLQAVMTGSLIEIPPMPSRDLSAKDALGKVLASANEAIEQCALASTGSHKKARTMLRALESGRTSKALNAFVARFGSVLQARHEVETLLSFDR